VLLPLDHCFIAISAIIFQGLFIIDRHLHSIYANVGVIMRILVVDEYGVSPARVDHKSDEKHINHEKARTNYEATFLCILCITDTFLARWFIHACPPFFVVTSILSL